MIALALRSPNAADCPLLAHSARTTRSATLPNVADPSEAFRTPTTSLLTATLRVIPPERRDRTISEDAEMSWPPSSTDDDRERPARRPSATLIPPFQPSGVSTDDEDGVTAHPRGIAITRATTMGRPSVAASTSDLMSPRRRRRGVRAGPRASSPASYPRRRELHGTGRRGGVESEPEDLSTAAAADDAFLALIDATKELVRLSASSSRPFTNDLPVASTAAVPADAIKARVASDHSTPSGGTLSAADLPSSFMAHSSEDALSPKPRSPPKEKERAMPTSSWMSWLYGALKTLCS